MIILCIYLTFSINYIKIMLGFLEFARPTALFAFDVLLFVVAIKMVFNAGFTERGWLGSCECET
jgi:hypothetical protein